MWFITNKGYIFGGASGYKIANFISPMVMEGYGTRSYFPISFVYQHDLGAEEPAGQDDGFLTIVNADAATS